MSANSGYTGIFKQPYANTDHYGDSIYVIADTKNQELNLILLTPGCYKDAYFVASAVTYQYINIFVPSMDSIFISDVLRLVFDLRRIKKMVQFIYPQHVTISPANVLFDQSHLKLSNYVSTHIPSCHITYQPADSSESMASAHLYDISVYDGKQFMLFTLKMDTTKLTTAFTGTDKYDSVHLPYNCTFYGGLTAKECGKLNPRWSPQIVANNFACREEFIECTTSHIATVGLRINAYTNME